LIRSLRCLRPDEVQSVTLLGDGAPLDWKLSAEGMAVKLPLARPCEHAYALKIVRGRPTA
jgi:hypothetical protein